MSERVAFVGSRDYPNLDRVREYVRALSDGDVVVSGGARGVDTAAADEANQRGLTTLEFSPDYTVYGERAPLVRNETIVANCDRVLAFWDGKSTGTLHTIRLAEKTGIPVIVVMEGE